MLKHAAWKMNSWLFVLCLCFMLNSATSLRDEDIKCASTRRKRTTRTVCPNGCQGGFWGDYCNRKCPKHCSKCDRSTFICSSCEKRYFGRFCSIQCLHCSYKCDQRGKCLATYTKYVHRSTHIRLTTTYRELKLSGDGVSRGVTNVTQSSSSRPSVSPTTVPDGVRNDTHTASSKLSAGSAAAAVGVLGVTHRDSSKISTVAATKPPGVPEIKVGDSRRSSRNPVVLLITIVVIVVFVLLVSIVIKYVYDVYIKKEKIPETDEEESLASETRSTHTYAEIDEECSAFRHHDTGCSETQEALPMTSVSPSSLRPPSCIGQLGIRELDSNESSDYLHPV